MSSGSTYASDRKPTRRPGRKAPTLRPETNTSVTAGVRVVKMQTMPYVKGTLSTTVVTTNSKRVKKPESIPVLIL